MIRYIRNLSEKMSFTDGILIYSFWSGYRLQPEMRNFLDECVKLGLRIITMHTSGHADTETLIKLIKWTKPKTLVPVHTENAQWFCDNFGNEINIIR